MFCEHQKIDTGLKFLVAESVCEINPFKIQKISIFGPILRKKIFERSAKSEALGSFVTSYAVVGWYYTPTQPNGSKGHNWCQGLAVGSPG